MIMETKEAHLNVLFFSLWYQKYWFHTWFSGAEYGTHYGITYINNAYYKTTGSYINVLGFFGYIFNV